MWNNFKNCFIKDNPVFGLFLGMCSTLAVSSSLNNAVGMGVCVIIVLVLSNVIISAMRKIVPDEIRIPVFIVVIASLVTILQMVLHAFVADLYTSLGAFLSLIVVNCIILGRAEAFASKNGIVPSLVDGLGMGLGYTFSLVLIALIRQVISTWGISFYNPFNPAQMIFDIKLPMESLKVTLFSSSVGAFFTFAVLAAIFAKIKANGEAKAKKEAAK